MTSEMPDENDVCVCDLCQTYGWHDSKEAREHILRQTRHEAYSEGYNAAKADLAQSQAGGGDALEKVEKYLREILPHDAPSQARKAAILSLLPEIKAALTPRAGEGCRYQGKCVDEAHYKIVKASYDAVFAELERLRKQPPADKVTLSEYE